MLNKTKIASIAVVMIAFASIAGITQFQNFGTEILNEANNSMKYPMPPEIQLGNYGIFQEFSSLKAENNNIKTLSSVKIPDLKLVDSRISHGGYVTSFYAPNNVKHTSDTTLPEFVKSGGVVVIFSEIGENYDVDAHISDYVKKTGNADLSFTINGDRAIGVLKNIEYDMPTKIHIYQKDGTFVTLLGWQSISELQKIAEALE